MKAKYFVIQVETNVWGNGKQPETEIIIFASAGRRRSSLWSVIFIFFKFPIPTLGSITNKKKEHQQQQPRIHLLAHLSFPCRLSSCHPPFLLAFAIRDLFPSFFFFLIFFPSFFLLFNSPIFLFLFLNFFSSSFLSFLLFSSFPSSTNLFVTSITLSPIYTKCLELLFRNP